MSKQKVTDMIGAPVAAGTKYINVGRVRVDTRNKVAMGIVIAGDQAINAEHPSRDSDEVALVLAAVAKRERKALKALKALAKGNTRAN